MGSTLESIGCHRRELLRHIGTVLGAGITAGVWSPVAAARAVQPGASAAATGIPRGAIIRTSLADIDPHAINGVTLMHEHLGDGRPPASGGPPATPVQDPAWMIEELSDTARSGVQCIVGAQSELIVPGMLPYLQTLSRGSGLHVVPAGGLFMLQRYSPDVRVGSEQQVADILVQAAAAGRFGAFGENGVSNAAADLAPEEKKAFRALGRAQARTGLPVLTHCNYSTGPNVPMDMGLRQLDLLEAGGARPQSCAIGHVCCLDDPRALLSQRLAKRGAFVAFDRLSRQEQWVSDEQRVVQIAALIEAGYIDNILFSSDYGGTINLATGERNAFTGPLHARDGGPGYARSLRLFLPKMRSAGIEERAIRAITVDNPRRFLAFVPKAA